jgi:hypothetical protein
LALPSFLLSFLPPFHSIPSPPFLQNGVQYVGERTWALETKTKLVIVSGLLVVVAIHYIEKRFRIVHRIREKYRQIRRRIISVYNDVIADIRKKSRFAAQLFPHVMFFLPTAVLTYMVPGVCKKVANDDVIGILACWYPVVSSIYYNATFEPKDEHNPRADAHLKCAKVLHTWIVVSVMYFIMKSVTLFLPNLAWSIVLSDVALGNGRDRLLTLIFLMWLHCPWTDGGI